MEYVENHSLKRKATDNHHEQIPSVQNTFITHVKNVTHLLIPVLIFLHLILN